MDVQPWGKPGSQSFFLPWILALQCFFALLTVLQHISFLVQFPSWQELLILLFLEVELMDNSCIIWRFLNFLQ